MFADGRDDLMGDLEFEGFSFLFALLLYSWWQIN